MLEEFRFYFAMCQVQLLCIGEGVCGRLWKNGAASGPTNRARPATGSNACPRQAVRRGRLLGAEGGAIIQLQAEDACFGTSYSSRNTWGMTMALRDSWIEKREAAAATANGNRNMSQMHLARQGFVTEEMQYIAKRERLEPELIRDE